MDGEGSETNRDRLVIANDSFCIVKSKAGGDGIDVVGSELNLGVGVGIFRGLLVRLGSTFAEFG